ncbi:MAG: sigma-70 family RNA polymerase sigma factor [Rhodospirillales bacterium]|nr:sigma-70 family RNA polymerase sigma factor [Rhodospirillales bacterium]
MIQLTHPDSPLAQARKPRQLRMSDSRRTLSAEDEARLHRVLTEKYECMYHEDFDLPEEKAVPRFFDNAPEVPKPDTSWYHPLMDTSTYDDVRSNKQVGSVLLTAKQEQALFLQFNYCRFRVMQLKEQLIGQDQIDAAKAAELLKWHDQAERYREQIADTNLALVLAMAKRTRMNESDFADMVSEGNMALLRAIDKFDVTRGFKFSTYACRAILKAFSRNGVKATKYRQMFPTDFDPQLERSNHMELKRQDHEGDCVDELKDIIASNRAELSQIEQEVIEHRFAIGKPEEESKPLTLEQVGKIIGVTKERVRQIQNKALEKIRLTLEDDFLA